MLFDCSCSAEPEDSAAFKMSYSDTHSQVCTTMYTKLSHRHGMQQRTCSHTNAPPFAFQKGINARGGGRGSVAPGFPQSACEVNES